MLTVEMYGVVNLVLGLCLSKLRIDNVQVESKGQGQSAPLCQAIEAIWRLKQANPLRGSTWASHCTVCLSQIKDSETCRTAKRLVICILFRLNSQRNFYSAPIRVV